MFGSLSVCSAIWGKVAALGGLPGGSYSRGPWSFEIAVPLLWRWKLQTGAGTRPHAVHALACSCPFRRCRCRSRASVGDRGISSQAGRSPVPFWRRLKGLGSERRRDGAFEWEVFEGSVAGRPFSPGTFKLDSWVEHLRQHERGHSTQIARQQQLVDQFQLAGMAKVTHLIAPIDGMIHQF